MERRLITLITAFIILLGLGAPVYAITDQQSIAIQSLLDEAQRRSRAPGMAMAVLVDGETHFFFSGLANRAHEVPADEDTLWELASVSKAFTGLALLLLEEQGQLSLSDSIADHLPWFTLRYQGQPVDMQGVRLYHLMHHTVGLTNGRHPNLILERTEPDTLQNTVEALIDAELVFYPGTQFAYGTVNYNVLGLVIESVTGQSYEAFMEEQLFRPLGLADTYANRDHAEATGRLAQGHVTTFIFATIERDSPEARGSVPTGYIITSARDMARWMGIQLGIVEDIPEIFKTIIPRSHELGRSVAEADGTFYAAGWVVSEDHRIIEHGGGNPGFSTYVRLLSEEQIGITLLINASGVDVVGMIYSIEDIFDGNLHQAYPIISMDVLFTIFTALGGLLAILFFLLGLRRMKRRQHYPVTKKRLVLIALWFAITLALCLVCFVPRIIPGMPFHNWTAIFMWVPYSILTGMIALTALSVSITWFVAFPRHTK